MEGLIVRDLLWTASQSMNNERFALDIQSKVHSERLTLVNQSKN
jgi:hypothetical protein